MWEKRHLVNTELRRLRTFKLRLELSILTKNLMRLAQVIVVAGLASILVALLVACGSSSPKIQTPPLSITTSSLPTAQVGVAYNAQLAATGGTPPYTWSLASGNLPPGLTLAASGAVAGTPTAAGTFNTSVMVTDSLGAQQTASYSISVQTPPLSITTSSLPTVQIGVAYNAQLAATGGAPPYTWSLTSGSLPPGLTLASNGAIAGTATAAGTFDISVMVTDSLGTHQTASYSMSVVIGTDAYGGFTAMPVSGCSPGGYFIVQKYSPGNHWVLVDPLCNAFQRRSVQFITYGQYQNEGSIIATRYGNNQNNWVTHTLERLAAYNFNAAGDYSEGTYYLPYTGSLRQPFSLLINPLGDAVYHPSNCGPYTSAIKDFLGSGALSSDVLNSWSYHPSGETPDVYDPMLYHCMLFEVSTSPGSARSNFSDGFATNQYITDISLGDMDYTFALRGSAADGYPNMGFLTMVVNPYSKDGGGTGTTFWTKVAWACSGWSHSSPQSCTGQSYLEQQYGTVGALNKAWGTSYTTFGSTGAWGTGQGVMDEDGRHTCTDALYMTGCNASVQADANQMLYLYTKQVLTTMITGLRTYDKNHLVSVLNFLDSQDATADVVRVQVLEAIRDVDSDIVHVLFDGSASRSASSAALLENVYNTSGKPVLPWYEVCANPDSDLSGQTCEIDNTAATQEQRGVQYNMDWGKLFNLQGSDGSYFVLGMDLWGWADSYGGTSNWGISTFNDNIYNGTCAVIAESTDPWGVACGGEAANYGDFLDGASATHMHYAQALINASAGGAGKK